MRAVRGGVLNGRSSLPVWMVWFDTAAEGFECLVRGTGDVPHALLRPVAAGVGIWRSGRRRLGP